MGHIRKVVANNKQEIGILKDGLEFVFLLFIPIIIPAVLMYLA